MNRRSSVQIVVVLIILLLGAFLVGRPGTDGPPLDPRSVNGDGTLGLVLFLEQSNMQVTDEVPFEGDGEGSDVALVLRDRFDEDTREEFRRWVRGGGDLVVADPSSPLVGLALSGSASSATFDQGRCTVPELAEAQSLALADSTELANGRIALFSIPDDVRRCFSRGDQAYVVRRSIGSGTITALGGAAPFTNRFLDEGDNAILAARLLAGTGTDGSDRQNISVIFSEIGPGGSELTLGDLIPTNVKWFGWQLVVVTAIGLLWAIRRFAPLTEELPIVELPGSLAVRATGEMHRRAKTEAASVAVLAASVSGRIRRHFRIPTDTDPEWAARQISQQSGVAEQDVLAVLTGQVPPGTDLKSSKSADVDHARAMDQIARQLLPAPVEVEPQPTNPVVTVDSSTVSSDSALEAPFASNAPNQSTPEPNEVSNV